MLACSVRSSVCTFGRSSGDEAAAAASRIERALSTDWAATGEPVVALSSASDGEKPGDDSAWPTTTSADDTAARVSGGSGAAAEGARSGGRIWVAASTAPADADTNGADAAAAKKDSTGGWAASRSGWERGGPRAERMEEVAVATADAEGDAPDASVGLMEAKSAEMAASARDTAEDAGADSGVVRSSDVEEFSEAASAAAVPDTLTLGGEKTREVSVGRPAEDSTLLRRERSVALGAEARNEAAAAAGAAVEPAAATKISVAAGAEEVEEEAAAEEAEEEAAASGGGVAERSGAPVARRLRRCDGGAPGGGGGEATGVKETMPTVALSAPARMDANASAPKALTPALVVTLEERDDDDVPFVAASA